MAIWSWPPCVNIQIQIQFHSIRFISVYVHRYMSNNKAVNDRGTIAICKIIDRLGYGFSDGLTQSANKLRMHFPYAGLRNVFVFSYPFYPIHNFPKVVTPYYHVQIETLFVIYWNIHATLLWYIEKKIHVSQLHKIICSSVCLPTCKTLVFYSWSM